MKCPKCGSEMLPLKKWLNEKVSRIVDRCLSCGHEEKVGGEPEPTVEISIHWAGKPPKEYQARSLSPRSISMHSHTS